MTQISITPAGPFSLAASSRFLEGFTPASHRRLTAGTLDETTDGEVRLAFTVDRSWLPAAVGVTQDPDGTVNAVIAGDADPAAVTPQLARILSLDIDASDYPRVVQHDPVVRDLAHRYPGLRPVAFNSPYEAACWAVIGQRLRIQQAADIRARIAEEHGPRVELDATLLPAFPSPHQLLGLHTIPGLPELKVQRLHAIARAALEGQLDATRLRSRDPEDALADLQKLPGIGPFSAELILIRGAAAPDCFPATERRLHRAMASAYGVDAAAVDELQQIADQWKPYRSWIAVLFRTHLEAAARGSQRSTTG